jgi:hypothetical protein
MVFLMGEGCTVGNDFEIKRATSFVQFSLPDRNPMGMACDLAFSEGEMRQLAASNTFRG